MKYVKSYEIKPEENHMATALIRFTEKMEVLSSAPYNGGHALTDCIFIMQVAHDFACEDFMSVLNAKIAQYSLPEDCVGFMTAAEVKYVFTEVEEPAGDLTVQVAATAGVTNAVCAGEDLTDWEHKSERSAEIYRKLIGGTINIVAVSPLPLTDAGKINMMIPIVEGKSMGMHDCGYRETGTTSDAMAVVSPVGEPRRGFAGTGTAIGKATALGVRKALKECLRKRGERPEGESAMQILAHDGVTYDHMWECATALGLSESFKDMFDETLQGMGSDPDVCSVVLGMMFAAHQGERDCICNQYEGDMPLNLVDGSMASFLASRISEDRGSDRVVDLMSMAALSDSNLPEHVQQAVYGLVAGVVGYITGYTDD